MATEVARQTYIDIDLHIEGVAPLLMNAPTLLDPLHPLSKQMADATKKKANQRTVADIERISRLEHRAHLYWHDELGPVVPTINIKKCVQEAGGRWRLGPPVKRGILFAERFVPLQYDGPRDPDALYDEGYVDHRPIKNGGMSGGRVMRTRPCFDSWSLDVSFKLDPHEIGVEDFGKSLTRSQTFGLGDYRPEFGLFVASFEVVS